MHTWNMNKLVALIIGLVLTFTGGFALADAAFVKPDDPHWMNVPCATPEHFKVSNCYWNGTQMGLGNGPSFFVHTFKAQHIRCYFYTPQVDKGQYRDHCVSTTARDQSIGLW